MSIPLVQEATKDAINTSIIAIKRNIERINMLLGLSNSEEIDTSEFVKKSDIVDEVAVGNMHSVTSNAVANLLIGEVDNSISTTTTTYTAPKSGFYYIMYDCGGNGGATDDLYLNDKIIGFGLAPNNSVIYVPLTVILKKGDVLRTSTNFSSSRIRIRAFRSFGID